jgi:transposase
MVSFNLDRLMISNLIKRQPPGHPGRKALRKTLTTRRRRRKKRKRRKRKRKKKKKLLKLREVLTNLSSPVRNAVS